MGDRGKAGISVRARHTAANPNRSASWRGHDDALVRPRLRTCDVDDTGCRGEERSRARGATFRTRTGYPTGSAPLRRVRPLVHHHRHEGALIRSERPVDIKERVKLLKRVRKKAKTLLAELENDDLARECWTPGAPLSEYRLLKGQSATRNLISYAEDHLERLKTIGGKGKAWHTELRRHHIHMTALFCAFLNRGFRPSRVNDKEGEYGVLLDVVRVRPSLNLSLPMRIGQGTGEGWCVSTWKITQRFSSIICASSG